MIFVYSLWCTALYRNVNFVNIKYSSYFCNIKI